MSYHCMLNLIEIAAVRYVGFAMSLKFLNESSSCEHTEKCFRFFSEFSTLSEWLWHSFPRCSLLIFRSSFHSGHLSSASSLNGWVCGCKCALHLMIQMHRFEKWIMTMSFTLFCCWPMNKWHWTYRFIEIAPKNFLHRFFQLTSFRIT